MKTRPYATISLIVLSVIVTFIAPAFDSSIYGVNGSPLQWWSFMPAQPFRQLGLTLLLAPFLHLNTEHLLINTILLVPVGLMIERKQSAKHLAITFLSIHLLTMVLLIISSTFGNLSNAYFLGMSHIVAGLYSYWALVNRKFSLLIFAAGILIAGFWKNQNPLTLLAHGLGIASGVILFGLGRLRRK